MAGHTGLPNERRPLRRHHLSALPRGKRFRAPSRLTEHADVVYLCFPNNPTGAVATRAQLERWVAYAQEHKALLLYDAAYEGYISDPAIPRSIFEIPGALECAVEFRSFSKTGGFTGVRCGFTVMSKRLLAQTADGRELPLHKLWHRRWSTKANSVSYPVQRGAEALYSPEGRAQVRRTDRALHGQRAHPERSGERAGLRVYGGKNAPYIWVAHADRPNELADVRPHAGRAERRHHPGQRLRLGRRRLLPHLRLQQPGKRRGSRAAAGRSIPFRSDSERGLAPARRGPANLSRLQKEEITELSRSLPQLYRFCFLMTGDAAKALEAFQNTLREAALLAARRQLPEIGSGLSTRRGTSASSSTKNDVQPESTAIAEQAIAPDAPGRVAQLEPAQLAAWIAAAPEPQRSALAFFYLNEFSHREMQNLLDVKMEELASLISHGRAQFQAWLNSGDGGDCAE